MPGNAVSMRVPGEGVERKHDQAESKHDEAERKHDADGTQTR